MPPKHYQHIRLAQPRLSHTLRAAGGQVSFTVSDAGTVDYYPHLDESVLGGQGTSKLTVMGFEIVVDATALKGEFSIASVGTFACEVPQRLRLLSGNQKFEHSELEFGFDTWKRVVNYDKRLDAQLAGRGSKVPTVALTLPQG